MNLQTGVCLHQRKTLRWRVCQRSPSLSWGLGRHGSSCVSGRPAAHTCYASVPSPVIAATVTNHSCLISISTTSLLFLQTSPPPPPPSYCHLAIFSSYMSQLLHWGVFSLFYNIPNVYRIPASLDVSPHFSGTPYYHSVRALVPPLPHTSIVISSLKASSCGRRCLKTSILFPSHLQLFPYLLTSTSLLHSWLNPSIWTFLLAKFLFLFYPLLAPSHPSPLLLIITSFFS